MIESRLPVVGYAGTEVTFIDGDFAVTYTLRTHEDYAHEEPMYRTPALQTLERMKNEKRGNQPAG